MDARTVLSELRAGRPPSSEGLAWFASALADGRVSDAQAGAFAMGLCRTGLDDAGRVALTLAMRDSGDRLSWDLPGPVVDKHSTGGIGDCVSLALAPMLAACGAHVPMISGRGLGHTGGTLDKLEAIPGLSTEVSEERFRAIVGDLGCAIVSATGDLAPADRRLYAVRDVTATVESVDLITASILSKKLAAGLEALVLDVKVGSGAFMASAEEAEALASALVSTARGAGCPAAALISDMDAPLAPSLGNALEVAEIMRLLAGPIPPGLERLADLTVALGGRLLTLCGMVASREEGEGRLREVLENGQAAELFGQMTAALGGPVDFVEHWRDRLPRAPVLREVPALEDGFVTAMDGRALGMAVVRLGGGRMRDGDRVNPSVGLSRVAQLGDRVGPGAPLALVHAANDDAAARAIDAVQAAITLGDTAPERRPLILRSL